MMREEREKFTALAECDELRALLRECRAELNHAAVFVRTRERMASVGVELYDALLVRIAEALEEKP